MNFPSQIFFNDINHGYRAAILKKSSLWLLPSYMAVATYCYYALQLYRTSLSETVKPYGLVLSMKTNCLNLTSENGAILNLNKRKELDRPCVNSCIYAETNLKTYVKLKIC